MISDHGPQFVAQFTCELYRPALLISFVDDGTIMAQSPTLEANLPKLVRAYSVVHELTEAMGLILEHTKSEGFHFSRKHGDVNPDIDLGYAPYTGATPLWPGTTWRYLGNTTGAGQTAVLRSRVARVRVWFPNPGPVGEPYPFWRCHGFFAGPVRVA
jgi:hypothetical protein